MFGPRHHLYSGNRRATGYNIGLGWSNHIITCAINTHDRSSYARQLWSEVSFVQRADTQKKGFKCGS